TITRGTTGVNRLRHSDRWLVHDELVRARLRASPDPPVVALGFVACSCAPLAPSAPRRAARPDVRSAWLEIDPDRVVPDRGGVRFGRGGFELAGLRPVLVRAFNVLRQYQEAEVAGAWATITAGLAPDGLLVDGTCDEL